MIRPFRGVHPQIHETAFVADSAQIIGDVHIGHQASVWFGSVVRGDMFYIRIGDRTNVQDNCVIHTRTGAHPAILEDEVTVGHSVTLHGCHVERGSLVTIRKARKTLPLASLPDASFFSVVRQKLKWSGSNV